MLSPVTRTSISSGFGWLRPFAAQSPRFVGIDIGIDRVRLATLGNDRATESRALGWLTQSEFPLPIDPQSPPRPDWVDVVCEVLTDRLPRCVDGDRNVAMIALPLPWVHYQTTPKTEIAAIQTQCDSMFTASIFQSRAHVSSWPIVAGKDQYLIAATAESAACRIAESIAAIGYQVQGIVPHGVALLHAAPMLTSLMPSVVLLLELSGGLIALQNQNGCGLCRHLPAFSHPAGKRPYLEDVEPWLQEIAGEVQATSRYASRLGGEIESPTTLFVCGEASQIDGVDAALAAMLNRPVAAWRYAGRRRPKQPSGHVDAGRLDSSMAVSLSLAYCATEILGGSRRRQR